MITKNEDDLTSIIAHGIAEAQGDAYAEYASEFDGYAKAAVDALKKNLAGFSTNGVNVWGSPDDIKAVVNWHHSHVTIVHLRRDLGHWREECGKINAHQAELLGALKALLLHAGIADVAGEDKDPEDHAAESRARRAIANAEGRSLDTFAPVADRHGGSLARFVPRRGHGLD